MKLFLSSLLLLFSVVYSQSDWGCNHWSLFPTDYCYISTSSLTYKYVCNGTDTITYEAYSSESDCESSTDVGTTISYSISDTLSSTVECDNDESCGYFSMTCSDTTFLVFVVDVCYSTDIIYSCSGSTLTQTSYAESDCSGSTTKTSVNYGSLSTYDDCEFLCEGGSSDSNKYNINLFSIFIITLSLLKQLL